MLHAPIVVLEGSVDGGALDAEQVAEFGGAALVGAVQRDEVRSWRA